MYRRDEKQAFYEINAAICTGSVFFHFLKTQFRGETCSKSNKIEL